MFRFLVVSLFSINPLPCLFLSFIHTCSFPLSRKQWLTYPNAVPSPPFLNGTLLEDVAASCSHGFLSVTRPKARAFGLDKPVLSLVHSPVGGSVPTFSSLGGTLTVKMATPSIGQRSLWKEKDGWEINHKVTFCFCFHMFQRHEMRLCVRTFVFGIGQGALLLEAAGTS